VRCPPAPTSADQQGRLLRALGAVPSQAQADGLDRVDGAFARALSDLNKLSTAKSSHGRAGGDEQCVYADAHMAPRGEDAELARNSDGDQMLSCMRAPATCSATLAISSIATATI